MIKMEIQGIKSLEKELETMKNNLDKVLRKTTIDCALILNNEIIINTPVDTGNLRNNWQMSQKGIEKSSNSYSIDLINPVEYGTYVNYGHRLINGKWWDGLHFIEKGETLARKSIDDVVKLNIEKFIKSVKGVD